MIRIVFILLFVFNVVYVKSQQVSIGISHPDSSAILDLHSIDKGFLLPRMTTMQRNAITNPNIGLTILNTDDGCEDIYNGQNWIKNCNLTKISSDTIHSIYWTPKSEYRGLVRSGAASFVINNKVYVMTGATSQYIVSKDVWEYEPKTDVWIKKNDFPGLGRFSGIAFSINGKGYLCTGQNIFYTGIGYGYLTLKDVWEYDPLLDSWTQKSDFPGTARNGAGSFVLNGKGYLVAGNTAPDVWEYDPLLDTWTQKSNFPGGARYYASSFIVNGKAYLGHGVYNNINFNDLWEYNVSSDTWTQKSNLPGTARYGAVGFSIQNKGYLGTGLISAEEPLNDFWEYNPVSDEWVQIKSLDGAKRGFSIGFSADNFGFVGTGLFQESYLKDFWQLTFDGKEFQKLPPIDALKFKGHDWTNNKTSLYNSKLNTKIGIGMKLPETKLHIDSPFELNNNFNGLMQLGSSEGTNIVIGKSEIKSTNDGVPSNLFLQNDGGDTYLGDALLTNGNLDVNGNVEMNYLSQVDNLNVDGSIITDRLYVNNLTTNSEIIGSIKYEMATRNVNPPYTANYQYSLLDLSHSFVKVVCESGDCLTCSGSGCAVIQFYNPEFQLSNGQLLILYGSGEPNRNLYMPCCDSANTGYKLSGNFQLTAGNTISLVWMEPENLWYELSRSNND